MAARALLREIRRVLAPDGIARIIVPDGELYLRTYAAQLAGDPTRTFPYQAEEQARDLWSPMVSVNRIFYQDRESLFGHRTIFDFPLLQLLLQEADFTRVVRRDFLDGADTTLLVDTPAWRVESLYAEASP
ncbi:MAG: hypothetical protein PSV13_12635 [Lacunisphaera sp.]|nr:hypothetical protein [Lacunisphaera sp.]